MTTRITAARYAALVVRAQRLGACYSALEWLCARRRSVASLVAWHPDWALWLAKEMPDENLLTPAQIDAAAQREPWEALSYAAARLSAKRLDFCAKKCPWAALQFASPLLTPAQIKRCEAARTSK